MEKLCFRHYKLVQKSKKGINLNYQVSTIDTKQIHLRVVVFQFPVSEFPRPNLQVQNLYTTYDLLY
jgi:hypothetical protein